MPKPFDKRHRVLSVFRAINDFHYLERCSLVIIPECWEKHIKHIAVLSCFGARYVSPSIILMRGKRPLAVESVPIRQQRCWKIAPPVFQRLVVALSALNKSRGSSDRA